MATGRRMSLFPCFFLGKYFVFVANQRFIPKNYSQQLFNLPSPRSNGTMNDIYPIRTRKGELEDNSKVTLNIARGQIQQHNATLKELRHFKLLKGWCDFKTR